MSKRVLDVGNCSADHRAIASLIIRQFGAEVVRAADLADATRQLQSQSFDLVLVNRQLNSDRGDGLEVIRHIKRDPHLAHVPVMLVSNFPEYQQEAVQAGAVEGFGKQSLHADETVERLKPLLS
jgi:two-component system, response regulator, stage 0 sporulation protein F